jgi:hypothetical protein
MKKPNTLSFKWNDQENVFTHPTPLILNFFSSHELTTFRAIVDDIESNSGIKKPMVILELLFFFVLIIGGFLGAFFLVLANENMWGGVLIFITSIILFFAYMGFKAI